MFQFPWCKHGCVSSCPFFLKSAVCCLCEHICNIIDLLLIWTLSWLYLACDDGVINSSLHDGGSSCGCTVWIGGGRAQSPGGSLTFNTRVGCDHQLQLPPGHPPEVLYFTPVLHTGHALVLLFFGNLFSNMEHTEKYQNTLPLPNFPTYIPIHIESGFHDAGIIPHCRGKDQAVDLFAKVLTYGHDL